MNISHEELLRAVFDRDVKRVEKILPLINMEDDGFAAMTLAQAKNHKECVKVMWPFIDVLYDNGRFVFWCVENDCFDLVRPHIEKIKTSFFSGGFFETLLYKKHFSDALDLLQGEGALIKRMESGGRIVDIAMELGDKTIVEHILHSYAHTPAKKTKCFMSLAKNKILAPWEMLEFGLDFCSQTSVNDAVFKKCVEHGNVTLLELFLTKSKNGASLNFDNLASLAVSKNFKSIFQKIILATTNEPLNDTLNECGRKQKKDWMDFLLTHRPDLRHKSLFYRAMHGDEHACRETTFSDTEKYSIAKTDAGLPTLRFLFAQNPTFFSCEDVYALTRENYWPLNNLLFLSKNIVFSDQQRETLLKILLNEASDKIFGTTKEDMKTLDEIYFHFLTNISENSEYNFLKEGLGAACELGLCRTMFYCIDKGQKAHVHHIQSAWESFAGDKNILKHLILHRKDSFEYMKKIFERNSLWGHIEEARKAITLDDKERLAQNISRTQLPRKNTRM